MNTYIQSLEISSGGITAITIWREDPNNPAYPLPDSWEARDYELTEASAGRINKWLENNHRNITDVEVQKHFVKLYANA